MAGKIRIGALAAELGKPVDEMVTLAATRLQPHEYKGSGRNIWLPDDAAETLRLAVAVPPAVPVLHRGRVIRPARNLRWVYALVGKMDGLKPVAIPARLRGKLIGKTIDIEAITDANGTSYRYAQPRRND